MSNPAAIEEQRRLLDEVKLSMPEFLGELLILHKGTYISFSSREFCRWFRLRKWRRSSRFPHSYIAHIFRVYLEFYALHAHVNLAVKRKKFYTFGATRRALITLLSVMSKKSAGDKSEGE